MRIEISTAMIPITTSNSTSVKARVAARLVMIPLFFGLSSTNRPTTAFDADRAIQNLIHDMKYVGSQQ